MQAVADNAQSVIQPHNEKPAAIWSSGGGAYEEVSRGILDSIEHCVDRLAPNAGERVLDIATGTGWTARSVARRGASVTGIDIAAEVLEAARELAARENLEIDFRVADAERLPFDDGAFDAVVSTCGIMFTSRPEDAAAELARVCRPGGRMAITTWTPDGNVFGMFKVMKPYMPEPPASPPPSPFEWGRPERVTELLSDAFELRFERGTSHYHKPSGEIAWNEFVEGYGPLRTLAGNLDADRRAALRRDFIDFHEQFRGDLGIRVPRDYWLTLGTRTAG